MTTHEVLVEARNLLEREGWSQGSHGGPGHCAATAVSRALPGYGINAAFEAFGRAAGLKVRSGSACPVAASEIFRWNDVPGRTQAEVLAAFDKAIAATAPEPDTAFLSKPLRDPVPA